MDFKIHFSDPQSRYWKKIPRGRRELLPRACGLANLSGDEHANIHSYVVWDATAGLLEDSFLLARLGCQVISFERNAELFGQLNRAKIDALAKSEAAENANERASETSQILKRIEIRNEDFLEFLRNENFSGPPKVIYWDPMFSDGVGSALPRLALQKLRKLVEPASEEEVLAGIEASLRLGAARVVLKRPLRSQVLFEDRIQHSYEGRSVRFDVYRSYPSHQSQF